MRALVERRGTRQRGPGKILPAHPSDRTYAVPSLATARAAPAAETQHAATNFRPCQQHQPTSLNLKHVVRGSRAAPQNEIVARERVKTTLSASNMVDSLSLFSFFCFQGTFQWFYLKARLAACASAPSLVSLLVSTLLLFLLLPPGKPLGCDLGVGAVEASCPGSSVRGVPLLGDVEEARSLVEVDVETLQPALMLAREAPRGIS